MLLGNFEEGTSKSADLGDVAANTMEAFIRYMYLGTLEEDDPFEELYKLGDRYMISNLKASFGSGQPPFNNFALDSMRQHVDQGSQC